MKNENSQTLAAIVDRLGALAAAAAEIDCEREALKAELILAGVPAIDGALFRAAVSHCPGRTVTDWRAIAEALGATDSLIQANTSAGTPYSVVRVSCRKGA